MLFFNFFDWLHASINSGQRREGLAKKRNSVIYSFTSASRLNNVCSCNLALQPLFCQARVGRLCSFEGLQPDCFHHLPERVNGSVRKPFCIRRKAVVTDLLFFTHAVNKDTNPSVRPCLWNEFYCFPPKQGVRCSGVMNAVVCRQVPSGETMKKKKVSPVPVRIW